MTYFSPRVKVLQSSCLTVGPFRPMDSFRRTPCHLCYNNTPITATYWAEKLTLFSQELRINRPIGPSAHRPTSAGALNLLACLQLGFEFPERCVSFLTFWNPKQWTGFRVYLGLHVTGRRQNPTNLILLSCGCRSATAICFGP